MKVEIDIRHVSQYYRNSTKEWCITVNYLTEHTGGILIYQNKKLNKAKKNLYKNLLYDICKDEIDSLREIKIESK